MGDKEELFCTTTKERPKDQHHKTKVTLDDWGEPQSHKRKSKVLDDFYDHVINTESSVLERAEEVQEKLGDIFPSFMKQMLRSHVTSGFLLGLPKQFCSLHLPMVDSELLLMDSNKEVYRVKYLGYRKALSGGWKTFSIKHKLVEGDVIVFQLIRPLDFKVYVVRTNGLDEVDGALGLMHLYAHSRRTDFVSAESERCLQLLETNYYAQENIEKSHQMPLLDATDPEPVKDQSHEDSEDLELVLEEITSKTVDIANEAKACNASISGYGFEAKDKILTDSGQLQANFGELLARLNHLDTLAIEAKEAVDSKKNRGMWLGQISRNEETKKTFVAKLVKLIEAKVRLCKEIAALKLNAKRLGIPL